mmetsp:Transcript_4078/g.8967  ORF Transcript_4078/g.8967 Transcript_4078/m.8967 type:complete len:248 (+) Transcript_4078:315-1058(+)
MEGTRARRPREKCTRARGRCARRGTTRCVGPRRARPNLGAGCCKSHRRCPRIGGTTWLLGFAARALYIPPRATHICRSRMLAVLAHTHPTKHPPSRPLHRPRRASPARSPTHPSRLEQRAPLQAQTRAASSRTPARALLVMMVLELSAPSRIRAPMSNIPRTMCLFAPESGPASSSVSPRDPHPPHTRPAFPVRSPRRLSFFALTPFVLPSNNDTILFCTNISRFLPSISVTEKELYTRDRRVNRSS